MKKLFSLALSLTLVLQLFSGFTAFAESETSAYTRKSAATLNGVGYDEADLTSDKNILYNFAYQSGALPNTLSERSFSFAKGTIAEDGTETTTAFNYNNEAEALKNVDGSVNENSSVFIVSYWNSGVKQDNVYADIIFNLGSVYALDEFLIADHISGTTMFLTDYSIFISNTAADLFAGDPLVSHETNTKRFNLFDLKGNQAQYIGIRVYCACNSSYTGNYTYLRTSEFALSGTAAYTRKSAATLNGVGYDEADLTSDKNILYNFAYQSGALPNTLSEKSFSFATGSIAEDGTETTTAFNYNKEAQALRNVDGSVDVNSDVFVVSYWNSGVKQDNVYADIIFNLGSVYALDEFLIADAISGTNMFLTDYSIFISNSADDLFAGDPLVSHIANTKRFNLFNLKGNQAQYIGIRVYCACDSTYTGNYTYLRTSEFALSGTAVYTRKSATTLNGVGFAEADLTSDKNILYNFAYQSGALPNTLSKKSFSFGKGSIAEDGTETTAAVTNVKEEEALKNVDGSVDVNSSVFIVSYWNSGVKQDNVYADIVFNLGEIYLLDKLLIADHISGTTMFLTDYSIFISNSANDLFAGDPIVDHAANTKRFNSFGFEGKEAQYIGIRVYCACNSAYTGNYTYLRTSEFALSGERKLKNSYVSFKDAKGEVVHTVTLNEGETAAAAAAQAEAKLGLNYGYTFAGWDEPTDVAISEDTTFTAVYKRDTTTTYALSFNGDDLDAISFDAKITLNANKKVLWKVNGEKFSIGSSVTAYAFGDMTFTSEDASELDENAPFVSLVNTIANTNDGQFIAFVRLYDPMGEITEYGASFWNATVANPTVFKTASFTEGADAMVTLYGIASGNQRGVKAFAKIGNDTIYSESIKTETF